MGKYDEAAELVGWRPQGFDWDEYNENKIRNKHGVSREECEDVLTIPKLRIFRDTTHSQIEERYFAYGLTETGRRLYIVFTRRADLIRVISARDMREREMQRYEA